MKLAYKMRGDFSVRRAGGSVYKRSEFFGEVLSGDAEKTYKRSQLVSGEALDTLVRQRVMETLCLWFSIPKMIYSTHEVTKGHGNYDIQARYVATLIRITGSTDILLFDAIWVGFTAVRSKILGVAEGELVTEEHWSAFEAYLEELFPKEKTGEHLLVTAAVSKFAHLCRLATPEASSEAIPNVADSILPPETAAVVPLYVQHEFLAAARMKFFIMAFLPSVPDIDCDEAPYNGKV